MTCIVGIVDHGEIFLGGDSAAIAGWSLTTRKDPKVFRNGRFIIGGTSSFRMLQLLHHAFTPPKYDPASDLETFMATTFIDGIRACFKNGGYAQKNSEQEAGGKFLVGFHGRLFCIDADYQVGEALAGYDAVGCGADVALGALYTTSNSSPRQWIELALKAAETHNAGVRAPFHIAMLEAPNSNPGD